MKYRYCCDPHLWMRTLKVKFFTPCTQPIQDRSRAQTQALGPSPVFFLQCPWSPRLETGNSSQACTALGVLSQGPRLYHRGTRTPSSVLSCLPGFYLGMLSATDFTQSFFTPQDPAPSTTPASACIFGEDSRCISHTSFSRMYLGMSWHWAC